jgi:hypothetical protein
VKWNLSSTKQTAGCFENQNGGHAIDWGSVLYKNGRTFLKNKTLTSMGISVFKMPNLSLSLFLFPHYFPHSIPSIYIDTLILKPLCLLKKHMVTTLST